MDSISDQQCFGHFVTSLGWVSYWIYIPYSTHPYLAWDGRLSDNTTDRLMYKQECYTHVRAAIVKQHVKLFFVHICDLWCIGHHVTSVYKNILKKVAIQ